MEVIPVHLQQSLLHDKYLNGGKSINRWIFLFFGRHIYCNLVVTWSKTEISSPFKFIINYRDDISRLRFFLHLSNFNNKMTDSVCSGCILINRSTDGVFFLILSSSHIPSGCFQIYSTIQEI